MEGSRSMARVCLIITGVLVAIGAVGFQGAAAASGRTLSLVAIGDSLPYGQDDCGFCATFVDRFGKAISRGTGLQV